MPVRMIFTKLPPRRRQSGEFALDLGSTRKLIWPCMEDSLRARTEACNISEQSAIGPWYRHTFVRWTQSLASGLIVDGQFALRLRTLVASGCKNTCGDNCSRSFSAKTRFKRAQPRSSHSGRQLRATNGRLMSTTAVTDKGDMRTKEFSGCEG